ncbi:hypothetical protein NQ314_015893 [Rhamnusium bicolor]|uniref:PiggyBac transposable element-derived protein domain-containing protein n=1 Tax=Rhamnusium bicolor TaxID=1586634 RepID=A0AAV8WY83_9CUCU|nr:hypothetical protein NQ314_015893 [Rhamnusium bicolor]
MNYDDYENVVFAEIPSGDESEDNEEGDGEADESDNAQICINQADEAVGAAMNANIITDCQVQDSNDDFSDDDLIPLSEVQAELNKEKFVWRKEIKNYTAPEEFNNEYGPCNFPENLELPVEVFLQLFPKSLFEHISYQTNLYATQNSSKTGKSFLPTNNQEIKIFFAINIMMGIKRLPSYRNFWSTRVELRDNYISSLMPRTRRHHHVYFDNYFTSLPLLRELKYDHVYVCGTVKKKRIGIPNDLKIDKSMARGDGDWRMTDDGISFMKWMDRKAVMFASNFHKPDLAETVDRQKKDGEKVTIGCPLMVKDYNSSMGYVDKADQLKSTYEISRKSKEWWHRIIWHFVDVAVVNSFIIFTERSGVNTMDLKTFRLSIVHGLVGASTELPRRGRPSAEVPVSYLKKNVSLEKRWDKAEHMPVHGTSRRCAMCSSRAEQYRTRWSCSNCEVGLCLTDKKNGFEKFHKKNY